MRDGYMAVGALRMGPEQWWVVMLQGLFAAMFGLVVLLWPELTLSAFIMVFGAFALGYGVVTLIGSIRGGLRWQSLLEGLAAVAIGVVTFVWPALTALALVYLIAAWALTIGILELVAAFAMRRPRLERVLLGLAGALSVIAGVLIAIFPGSGALALTILIGAYALAFGVLLFGLALSLRNSTLEHRVPAGSPRHQST